VTDNENVDWDAMEESAVDPDQGPQPIIISADMLAKRIMWDVTPCDMAERVRDYLGYAPTSDEVEEKEHIESHQRLKDASPMIPVVHDMALHATRAIVASMIVGAGDEETLPESDRDEVMEKTVPIVYHATYAILAELLDIGAVHFPHFAFLVQGEGGEFMEEEDVD
jgi:hypothetical protein